MMVGTVAHNDSLGARKGRGDAKFLWVRKVDKKEKNLVKSSVHQRVSVRKPTRKNRKKSAQKSLAAKMVLAG